MTEVLPDSDFWLAQLFYNAHKQAAQYVFRAGNDFVYHSLYCQQLIVFLVCLVKIVLNKINGSALVHVVSLYFRFSKVKTCGMTRHQLSWACVICTE